MKKKRLLCLSVILIFSNYTFLNSKGIIWNHGVAIINNAPVYFDPDQIDIPEMEMTAVSVKKNKSDIISAYKIIFLKEKDESVYLITRDCYKNDKHIITGSERKLFYKIENNSLYISDNKNNWEKLQVIFLNKKPYDAGDVTVWWKVFVKCKWFEGEYEIISTAFDGPRSIEEFYLWRVTASSVKLENNRPINTYAAYKAVDGNSSTAWVSDNTHSENGIDDYIEINIGNSIISDIEILPGFAKSEKLYQQNNRPEKIEIIFKGDETTNKKNHIFFKLEYTLKDKMEYQRIEIPFIAEIMTDSEWNNVAVRIIIKSIYKGTKYSDTCFSEIRIIEKDGNDLTKKMRDEVKKKGLKEIND